MGRTSAGLLIACLLAGAVLWAWLDSSEPDGRGAAASPTVAQGSDQVAADARPEGDELSLRPVEPRSSARGRTELGSFGGAATAIDAAAPLEVEMLVVDKVHGLPVADARIDLARADDESDPDRSSRARWRWREAGVTDRFGRTRVQVAPAENRLSVRLPWRRIDLGALAELVASRERSTSGADEPLRLAIHTKPLVPLELLGEDGRPVVGARAAVRLATRGTSLGGGSRWSEEPTDEAGFVVAPVDASGKVGPFVLAVESLGIADRGPRLEFPASWDEPLVATLPPHGSILVTAHDEHGVPLRAGSRITLSLADSWSDFDAELDESGSYRLAVVGLGRQFELSTAVATRTFAGPTTDGENVEVSIVGPTVRAGLTGRLVDGDGEPARFTLHQFEIVTRSGGSRAQSFDENDLAGVASHRIDVDRDGRFSTGPLDFLPLSFELAELRVVSKRYGLAVARLPDELGVAALGTDLVDLGNLAMSSSLLTTAGILTFPLDRPASRVPVELRVVDGPSLGRTVSDAEGRFSIQHPIPLEGAEARVTIEVEEQSWRVQLGSRDNLVRLAAPPRIEFVLERARTGIPSEPPLVCVTNAETGAMQGSSPVPFGDEWSFELDHPGTYDLWVLSPSGAGVLAAVEELRIGRDQVIRLDPIRVGDGLRRTDVDVVNGRGEPVPGASVRLGSAGTTFGAVTLTDSAGRASLSAPPADLDVVVVRDGFDPRWALEPLRPGPLEVRLTKRAVVVRLEAPPALAPEVAEGPRAILRRDGPNGSREVTLSWDRASRAWTGEVPWAGSYQLLRPGGRDAVLIREIEVPYTNDPVVVSLTEAEFRLLGGR
ncbi:carboxypeptidase-like regulatory domain-containing protein [Engelhardtia mirabilis]|uniref:Uncharacterized protein n=1 Tax=Engelhardtia mirabilis TaxID=2528011 RepID=A0A518BRY0_9BACT|nr:hypothetical protein Pla133_48500 [Planctomycetes bacterium Pla133]QDV04054.1 hypothetical protein Pla86_48480 [Planctomycetes bacterium Pla86]